MCDTAAHEDMDNFIEYEFSRDDCIEIDDGSQHDEHHVVGEEYGGGIYMHDDYEIVEALEDEEDVEQQIGHNAIIIKPEIMEADNHQESVLLMKTEHLEGDHQTVTGNIHGGYGVDDDEFEYEEHVEEAVDDDLEPHHDTTTTAQIETLVPEKLEKATGEIKESKEEVNTEGDDKEKVTSQNTVHRRYMLFDELVACIVDYDPDGTPIVEFSISNAETDEKLPMECGICPEIMSRGKIAKHLKTHLVPGTNRYQCVYCDETYKDCKYLAGHARRHMGIRPYVCEICKLYFSTKQDLRVHNQRRHQEKDHICEVCGKTFAQNTQLKRHREATHEKKRRFQCEHCPKSYYKNFSLQEHVRAVHMGKRRMIVCPFCGMQCRDAHKMARHRKMMHLHQTHFECQICNEEFTDINYFDAHKRSIQCRNNTRRKMEEEALLREQNEQQEMQQQQEEEQLPPKTETLVQHENVDLIDANEQYINEFVDDEEEEDGMVMSTGQIINEEDIKHFIPHHHQQQQHRHQSGQFLINQQHHKVELINAEDVNDDDELVYEITIDSNE
ncbi:oocyte zinc finger protein XlCOF28-like [Musca vetustissima]|uniref:oocyte zinc finger protein XlCOF28-like n=1 Tax=Musca vetustissima TaxID=27455 RepID=UPI002AB7D7EC|nr:oocyte zinc finger protein XlCOF28-like [Musca vetustissima]